MPNPQKEEELMFQKFLATRKVLIADGSSTARSSVFKIFKDLGSPINQIILVNSFKQAVEQISQSQPDIVVSEYDLDRRSGSGLDLLQSMRSSDSKLKEKLFVVVTGNTSQTAVARSAEEDIDAFIIKPFTPETMRKTILKAAVTKLKPPPYLKLIEEGKAALETQNFDEAQKKFQEATKLDSAPSLAFYYLGQTNYLRQILGKAKGDYSQGLEYNKIHYKCLVGLYDLLVSQKAHEEAYEVIKKVSQYFPANPKRLSEVLKLAVMNGKYEDVEKYYQIFTSIDERDEMLIKYICAALVVCGKYYLQTKMRSRALELFKKASATGTGRVNILKQIVQTLLDFELGKEAGEYLKKFPPEAHKSKEYLLLEFQVLNVDGQLGKILDFGKKLLQQGIHDENVYAIMIRRTAEAKWASAAEDLVVDAVKLYPKQKSRFEQAFRSVKTGD